ncbi:MAG TPA: NAD(P)H-binding protein, partial [Gemmatimonadaceae bacterium]|nr:NAD(P)H-binding protein [Gemmatimonadaceae bacterium]
MNIFLAGATGAVGKSLLPALRDRGHKVVALTRSAEKAAALRSAGAQPVVADALDRAAVVRAVKESRAEVVIHQLTGLTGATSIRHFDRVFASTNRLRTEGTDILLEAARAAGARRFVAQSYGNWVYGWSGNGLKTERDVLDPHPLPQQKESLAAIRHLEQAVTSDRTITGIALRFGSLYGPGTNMA